MPLGIYGPKAKSRTSPQTGNRPLPNVARDPLAKGVAAGPKVKSKKSRSNPGASMLSGRY